MQALVHHLAQTNSSLPADAQLFAYQHKSGWRALTKKAFLDECASVWVRSGVDVIPRGHSFRIGGTAELLLRGTPPDVVMLQGRWKSRAFLRYWRKVEVIFPLFVSSAP